MSINQDQRMIALSTALGPNVLGLRSFSCHEELSRLFHIEAELTCETEGIDLDEVVGHNATIRMLTSGQESRFFNGYISRLLQVSQHGGHSHYRATIVPWLWFLTRNADCRIWVAAEEPTQGKTIPDIVEAVFKVHGFNDYRLSLTRTYPKREFVVQYRETDFNFVSRLLEQEGIYYFFEHENGKHTLVLADSTSAHSPFPDFEELPFHDLGRGAAPRDAITEWTVQKEVQPVATALKDFDFKKPRTSLLTNTNVARSHGAANFEIYDYPGEYLEAGDGDQLVQARLDELQTQYEVFNGQSCARGLAAGSTFKLKSHPRKNQNREYLITSVSLHADAGEFAAQDTGPAAEEETFSCTLMAIDQDRQFRPARLTPKPVVQGLQTAMVVGPKGEEIYTDKFGRVKVQFPWDRYGQADQNSSCWIRVSSEWAGKKWGAIYLPRIGQEVLVEYLEGDPDRPLITGRVYNGDAMPPYDLPAEKTKSTLKSNSSKGGNGFNEIRFEDKKDSEQIFVHAQHNMDVRVRNNLKETVYGNREIRVGWEKDGASGGKLNTLVKLDTNTHIKGNQIDHVEKDLNQIIDGAVIEIYKKDQTTKVDGTKTVNAKEVVTETSDAISEKTGKFTLEAGQEIGVKGGAINIESSQGISMKCGGNFVTIDPSGVAINGTMVLVNSGGAAKPAAPAKSAQIPDVLGALDALVADDSVTGAVTHGVSHGPRTNPIFSNQPIKAPPYRPYVPRPSSPPPPPPPAQKPQDTHCSLIEIKATCGHKEDEHHKSRLRSVSGDGTTLQVVPTKALGFDTIELEAKGNDCCGSHPEWFITGRASKKGVKTSFEATGPLTSKFWIPRFAPNEYAVRCETCNGVSKELQVHAYPSNQVNIKLDLKRLVEAIHLFMKGIDFMTELVADESHLKVLEIKASSAECGWREFEDWRAYYHYKIAFAADPIIGWEGKLSLGTSRITNVVKKVPGVGKYLNDAIAWLVKAGVYVKPTVGLSLEIKYERTSPEQREFSSNLGGGIQGKGGVMLGAEVSAIGGQVLKVDIEAGGELAIICESLIDEHGWGCAIKFEFSGLKGVLTLHLAWGLIDIEKSSQLTDPHTSSPKEYYFHRNDE